VPDSLTSSPVRPLLDRLFQAAHGDQTHWAAIRERHPDGFAGLSAREQAWPTCPVATTLRRSRIHHDNRNGPSA
jgi:hypothetical protein